MKRRIIVSPSRSAGMKRRWADPVYKAAQVDLYTQPAYQESHSAGLQPYRVLSDSEVRYIRSVELRGSGRPPKLPDGKTTYGELAAQLGVSPSTVRNARLKLHYRHVK